MLSDDLLKGAKAAAAYCGLSTNIIYRMVEDGRLPVIRLGKTLFFKKSELEAAFRSETAAG